MKKTGLRRWWRLLAALLVPLIVAGGLLASNWQRQARMERVTAALVNDDEMIKLNGQAVPAGRMLADALINTHQSNITWELANDDGGRDGLRDGKYAAVVTVPKNFSADALSFATDPTHARQATVSVAVSQQAAAADPQLATTLFNAATTTLNQQLSKLYLNGLFSGFADQATQLQKVSDAAGQLADAGGQLADGNQQLAGGLDKTRDGVTQLQSGVTQLSSGAQQFATGVKQYTGGVDQAASGAQQYANGVQQYTDGVTKAASGFGQLVDGVQQYTEGVDKAAAGAGPLADGVKKYTGGVDQAAAGMGQLNAQLPQLAQGTHDYVNGVNQLTAGIGPFAQGAKGVADGVVQVNTQLKAAQGTLAPAAVSSAAAQQALTPAAVDTICRQAALAVGVAAPTAAQLTQCAQNVAPGLQVVTGTAATVGWQSGVGAGVQALNTAGPSGQTLVQGAQQLSDGAGKISTSTGQLDQAGQQLTAGMDQAAGGVSQLTTGLEQLSAGSPALNDGVGQLASGLQQLSANSAQLNSGLGQVNSGLQQLAQNSGQINSGATQLASGLQQLSAGSAQLNDGAEQLASGTQQLSDQLPQLSSGISQLDDASHKLADGAKQLADGQRQFADGFKNQAQVPSYTPDEREHLATAIAQPVKLVATDTVTAANPFTAVLIALVALWIGALATFLARRPIPRVVAHGNRSTAGNIASSLLPGLAVVEAQALGLWIILAVTLKPSLAHLGALLGVLLVAGLCFALLNHMLAAVFGWGGRLVAVIFATLAVAGGMTAALPQLFGTLSALNPVSAAVSAAAAAVSGGSGVTGSILTLLAWGVVALIMSSFAILAGGRISPRSLRVAEA